MKIMHVITSQAFDNFPEISGKFPEILNFLKVYNPSLVPLVGPQVESVQSA